jgi:hypothetical protein
MGSENVGVMVTPPDDGLAVALASGDVLRAACTVNAAEVEMAVSVFAPGAGRLQEDNRIPATNKLITFFISSLPVDVLDVPVR